MSKKSEERSEEPTTLEKLTEAGLTQAQLAERALVAQLAVRLHLGGRKLPAAVADAKELLELIDDQAGLSARDSRALSEAMGEETVEE